MAFMWWYLDVLDEDGNGCVCTFSNKLPFLPDAQLSNAPQRLAMNIVIYKHGQEDFYVLEENEGSGYQSQVEDGVLSETWQIGDYEVHRLIQNNTVQLRVECKGNLDCAHRVQGTIEMTGALLSCKSNPLPEDLHSGLFPKKSLLHQWLPIMTNCQADVNLKTSIAQYQFKGRGYHDSNISTHDLRDLNIQFWWWGRIPFQKGELIFYFLQHDFLNQIMDFCLWVDEKQQVTFLPVRECKVLSYNSTIYGLSFPKKWTIETPQDVFEMTTINILDDSPFYQRFYLQVAHQGNVSTGFFEQVVPIRLNIPWQQPFIRMRTHQDTQYGSLFAPLFTGNRKGRVGRFLKNLFD